MIKLVMPCLLLTAACAGDDPTVSGTWRAQPNAFATGVVTIGPDEWTFRDDGIVVATGADGDLEGQYEIEGDRMSMAFSAEDDSLQLDFSFVVTADELLLGALLPGGEVDGAIGTWSDTGTINGEVSSRTLTLDAAGTLRSELDGIVDTGTWEEDGASLVLRFESHDDYWFRVGEEGIGDVLLQRVD